MNSKKEERGQRRQEQCESLFEQCVFAEGVQCAGSVWVSFFWVFYNASCEVEQRMVVWRVERCDWAEREERVVPRRRDETVNERGTATREHGHG